MLNDQDIEDTDNDFFSSSGFVKVRILEAVDVLDSIEKASNPADKKQLHHTHVIIGIGQDERNSIKFSTCPLPYTTRGSSQLKIGEEFLFQVSSTNILTASFHALRKGVIALQDNPDVSIPCVGSVTVPISRLGESVSVRLHLQTFLFSILIFLFHDKVVQWYQMVSVEKGEGLRAAIKLEVININEFDCLQCVL